jgi:hypothetical protein
VARKGPNLRAMATGSATAGARISSRPSDRVAGRQLLTANLSPDLAARPALRVKAGGMSQSRFRQPAGRAALLFGCGLLLAGCDSGGLSRTFGLSRDAPDEFTVTTRAPLSMPPDFSLRPPRPGAPRPQEQSVQRQAEETLVPQTALGTPAAASTPGEQALLEQAGPPVPSTIRQEVNRDANVDSGDPGFVDRLLFWKKPQTTAVLVDPRRESQRLRTNAALGDGPGNGETPIIQPPRKGWLQSLF